MSRKMTVNRGNASHYQLNYTHLVQETNYKQQNQNYDAQHVKWIVHEFSLKC